LNATNEEAAFRIIAGTARSMVSKSQDKPSTTPESRQSGLVGTAITIMPSKRYKKALGLVDSEKVVSAFVGRRNAGQVPKSQVQ